MYPLNAVDYWTLSSKYKDNMGLIVVSLVENKNQEDLSVFIKKNIQRNINNSIIHSHKIVKGFFKKEYPYLVKDKFIDLNNHVFSHNQDNSLSNIEKQRLIKKIQSNPMDDSRPMWEIHIIYNFNKNKETALIRKTHHCLADRDVNISTYNIFFDEFTLPNQNINNKNINVYNCSLSIIRRYISFCFLFLYGFLFKSNKAKISDIDFSNILNEPWERKAKTDKSFNITQCESEYIYNECQRLDVSFVDISLYIFASAYRKYLIQNNKDVRKTAYTSIPYSLRNPKKPIKNLHGTTMRTMICNLHINEEDNKKRLNSIRQSVTEQTVLRKTSPLNFYFRGMITYPFTLGFMKTLRLEYRYSWQNSKKIPKKKKRAIPIASGSSIVRMGQEDEGWTINGNKVKETNSYSIVACTRGSIGIATNFKLNSNNSKKLTLATASLDALVSKPKQFQKCLQETIKEIKEIPGVHP